MAQLISFANELTEEEQRGIAENLSEEELALFDLLTRPNLKLSRTEKEGVKAVARELLDTLKAERLVWIGERNNKPAPASSLSSSRS